MSCDDVWGDDDDDLESPLPPWPGREGHTLTRLPERWEFVALGGDVPDAGLGAGCDRVEKDPPNTVVVMSLIRGDGKPRFAPWCGASDAPHTPGGCWRQRTRGVEVPHLSHHTACVAPGRGILVYGGSSFEGSHTFSSPDVFSLDPERWLWERLTPADTIDAPKPRSRHAASMLAPDLMVVFGGAWVPEDTGLFDLRAMRWRRVTSLEAPPCRDSHGGCTVPGLGFVVFGGSGHSKKCELDDVWLFRRETEKWERVVTAGIGPGARKSFGVCVVGDCVYVSGGFGGMRYFNDVWELNTSTWRWRRLGECFRRLVYLFGAADQTLSVLVHSHAVAAIEEAFLMVSFGGSSRLSSIADTDVISVSGSH